MEREAFSEQTDLVISEGMPRGDLARRLRDPRRNSLRVHFASDVDETALAQTSKPRPLPLREAPRAVGDAGDHFVVIVFARQVSKRFSITDRLASRAAELADRRQLSNLVDESGTDHRPNALFDPPMQLLARASQHENATLLRRPAFLELQLLMTDRLASRTVDFQRPDQPPRIVRMNVRCGNRIDLHQSIVERRLADLFELLLDLAAAFANRRAARRTGHGAGF